MAFVLVCFGIVVVVVLPVGRFVVVMPGGGKKGSDGQDQQFLWAVFQRVDRDSGGSIDAGELGYALSNGTWTPFNPETVRVIINMFDTDGDGRIEFGEFESVWKYICNWQKTFKRFDKDGSKAIDSDELKQCLALSGYRLSDHFVNMLVHRYDRTHTNRLNFDDFIQVCVTLQILTGSFRDKDKNKTGTIQVGYEEFLTMVVKSKI